MSEKPWWMRDDLGDLVRIDPEIHSGDPCIRGTRIPVFVILEALAQGMTEQQVYEDYPTLPPNSVRAALSYAAGVLQGDIPMPEAAKPFDEPE